MFFSAGGILRWEERKKDLSAEWANKTLLPCSVFTARVNYEEEEERTIYKPTSSGHRMMRYRSYPGFCGAGGRCFN